jgi:AcrR family transcriptional regulator
MDQTNKKHETADAVLDSSGSREKLLEVALQLFAEKGLDGVTTRDIAREAGLNISLISYYFGGKEGLYKACITDFAEYVQGHLAKLASAVEDQEITRDSYIRFMKALISTMVTIKQKSPQISEIMIREVVEGLPHAREVYETVFSQMAERVTKLMTAAQKKGIVRPDLNVYTLFLSLVHSVDFYFLSRKCQTPFTKKCYRFPEQTQEFIDQTVKVFVEGVLL